MLCNEIWWHLFHSYMVVTCRQVHFCSSVCSRSSHGIYINILYTSENVCSIHLFCLYPNIIVIRFLSMVYQERSLTSNRITAPIRYLNQCWFLSSYVLFTWWPFPSPMFSIFILLMSFDITKLILQPHLPGASELKHGRVITSTYTVGLISHPWTEPPYTLGSEWSYATIYHRCIHGCIYSPLLYWVSKAHGILLYVLTRDNSK